MQKFQKRKGFTLIELLVVISIIALLVSILMPALSNAREQARKVVCLSHEKSLINGIHIYAMDYDGNIPSNIAYNNASWGFICWETYDPPARWVSLGRLYGTGIIEDPEIFYCPSQKNKLLQNIDSEGWNWVSPNTYVERAISYIYGLLGEIRSMPELELKTMKLSKLKLRPLICDTFVPFGTGPVWSHPKGLSTGFGDGHVEFIQIDKEIIKVAEDLDNYSTNDRDLFVAAMFELLAGKSWIMDQYFPY